MHTLISLFRLRAGDHPNSADWGRCLLLVCQRIRQVRAPQRFALRPHRHSHHELSHFAHGSDVLLLSYLDADQKCVALLGDHRRMCT